MKQINLIMFAFLLILLQNNKSFACAMLIESTTAKHFDIDSTYRGNDNLRVLDIEIVTKGGNLDSLMVKGFTLATNNTIAEISNAKIWYEQRAASNAPNTKRYYQIGSTIINPTGDSFSVGFSFKLSQQDTSRFFLSFDVDENINLSSNIDARLIDIQLESKSGINRLDTPITLDPVGSIAVMDDSRLPPLVRKAGKFAYLTFGSKSSKGDPFPDLMLPAKSSVTADNFGNSLLSMSASGVKNKYGNLIQNNGLIKANILYSNILVPVPCSDTLYYAIGLKDDSLHYWLIDITANNDSAAVVKTYPPMFSGVKPFVVGGNAFAVVHHANGNNIWFTTSDKKTDLYSFLIEKDKIASPVISPGITGDPIFSPDGEWIFRRKAIFDTAAWNNSNALARFDNQTGIAIHFLNFSRTFVAPPYSDVSASFSPNSSKLYVAIHSGMSSNNRTINIYQYDLNAGGGNNPSAIDASEQLIHTNPYQPLLFDMQNAPDGRIYMSDIGSALGKWDPYTRSRIGYIVNPDEIYPAAFVKPDDVYIDGRWSQSNFPVFIESYFDNKGTYDFSYLEYDVLDYSIQGEMCLGATTQFNSNNAQDTTLSYLWTLPNGVTDTNATMTFQFDAGGQYEVTLIENSICRRDTFIDTVNIIEMIPLVSNDTALCFGETVLLSASGGSSYAWTSIDGINQGTGSNISVTINNNIEYIVTIDSASCSEKDTVVLSLGNCSSIYIPNAFSPNGDGYNDVFLSQNKDIREATLAIYDRWGNKVFETNDALHGWDGRNKKGHLMSQSVYVYKINGVYISGEAINLRGNVTLIK